MIHETQATWELLLSHHPPEHLHRALLFRVGRRPFRVCARCLGAAAGVGLVLCGGRALLGSAAATPLPVFLLVVAGMGSGMLDFYLQLVHARESTNPRRVLTGLLAGSAAGLSILAALRVHPAFVLAVPALVAGYVLALLAGASGREHLLAHLSRYATYCACCVSPHTRPGRHEASAGLSSTDAPSEEPHHERQP